MKCLFESNFDKNFDYTVSLFLTNLVRVFFSKNLQRHCKLFIRNVVMKNMAVPIIIVLWLLIGIGHGMNIIPIFVQAIFIKEPQTTAITMSL